MTLGGIFGAICLQSAMLCQIAYLHAKAIGSKEPMTGLIAINLVWAIIGAYLLVKAWT